MQAAHRCGEPRERCLVKSLKTIGVGLLVVLAAGASIASSDNTAEKVDTASSASKSSSKPASQPKSFKVGDVVKLGDWTVVVRSVKNPLKPGEFDSLEAGDKFVGVDVEVKNTSDKAQPFSGLMAFELVDSANQTYDVTFSSHKPQLPDGEIAAGRAKRGLAVFEVPKNAKGLELSFKGDFWSTGSAFVKLS